MSKIMKSVSVISVIATICFSVLYVYNSMPVFYSLAITFGTIAYHFCVRLMVGTLFNVFMKNRANYTKKWYRVKEWEQKLYVKLKVKKWKNKMPTYDTDAFDVSEHGWDGVAQASCQSELVHETNVVLSLVPIIFSVWFGSLVVFIITSVLGAMYDLIFVIMQRYNRPRMIKMISRSANTKS